MWADITLAERDTPSNRRFAGTATRHKSAEPTRLLGDPLWRGPEHQAEEEMSTPHDAGQSEKQMEGGKPSFGPVSDQADTESPGGTAMWVDVHSAQQHQPQYREVFLEQFEGAWPPTLEPGARGPDGPEQWNVDEATRLVPDAFGQDKMDVQLSDDLAKCQAGLSELPNSTPFELKVMQTTVATAGFSMTSRKGGGGEVLVSGTAALTVMLGPYKGVQKSFSLSGRCVGSSISFAGSQSMSLGTLSATVGLGVRKDLANPKAAIQAGLLFTLKTLDLSSLPGVKGTQGVENLPTLSSTEIMVSNFNGALSMVKASPGTKLVQALVMARDKELAKQKALLRLPVTVIVTQALTQALTLAKPSLDPS